ncbi:MAG: class I SAM-dependent methyltransferase [Akkermansiaceae bacterium]
MEQPQEIDGSLLEYAHKLIRNCAKTGDLAVDATTGNGHDTLFLTRCVGHSGQVYGFDIQSDAIDATRQRLDDAEIDPSAYSLVCDSHANMARHVNKQVQVVMFNLGYLPGSDKSVITLAETTLQALSAAVDLMAAGGVLTVMCYPGHDGGKEEAALVTDWLARINPECGELRSYRRRGTSDSAPFLLVVTKKAASTIGDASRRSMVETKSAP